MAARAEVNELNFYELINVSRRATQNEIEKAFRRRALDLHPDKNFGNKEMMQRLVEAKETLLDPDKRQKYDEEHDDLGGDQEVSGFLNCGKRASSRFKRKLARYMSEFDAIEIFDNSGVVSDILNDLKDKIDLIRTSIDPTAYVADGTNHTRALQKLFYEGNYFNLAEYLIANHCESSSIQPVYTTLTHNRDLTCTPPTFQAGILLLKGQIQARNMDHQASLKTFQEAVLTSIEIIPAVNVLINNNHLISSLSTIVHQLLNGDTDFIQEHLYSHRLVRSKHVKLVSKFEKSLAEDSSLSNWDKALMYIDLTMSSSGIALIHSFLTSMIYMMKDITTDVNVSCARVYAICSIISELAAIVVVLAHRCALPITELHYNKIVLIILRRSYDKLKSRVPLMKRSLIANIFKTFAEIMSSREKRKSNLVSDNQKDILKMIANNIHRLIKVSPLVDLQLTTATDMIYVDVVCDQFTKNFYHTQLTNVNRLNSVEWSHLYQYYLLECAWKTSDDTSKFEDCRMTSMNVLLEKNSWVADEVEDTMSWEVLNRTFDGYLDLTRPWLNLPGKNYNSVDGIEIDVEDGTFRLICSLTPSGSGGLFNDQDIAEIILNGQQYSIFTLDPPNSDLQYHPFQEQRYSPASLAHTNLLQTLLHADYLLKMITIGKEVSANSPHCFGSDRFLNLLTPNLRNKIRPLRERRGGNRKEAAHRFWIESGEMQYKCEVINDRIKRYVFGDCPMQVKTHPMKNNSDGDLVDDSDDDDESEEEEVDGKWQKIASKEKKKRITAEAEFANDFTDVYDQVGEHFPVLLRLRELMKLMTIYNVLKQTYDSLESCKKDLKGDLTTRYTKLAKEMREKVSYPQNCSSNVNKISKSILRDQGLSESNVRSSDLDELKRSIRRQLDEVDERTVAQTAETIASSLEISNTYTFKNKVKRLLGAVFFAGSEIEEFTAHIVEELYPRKYEQLDRFAHHAEMVGICFEDDDTRSGGGLSKADTEECPWVPAMFAREDNYRVYGGVCLTPKLSLVENLPRSNTKSFSGTPFQSSGNGFSGNGSSGNRSSGNRSSGGGSSSNGSSGGGSSGKGSPPGGRKSRDHGNSRTSNRAQHVYEIYKHNPGGNLYVQANPGARQHPTLVYKVGISNDKVYQRNKENTPNRIGNSVRAQRQADRLNQIYINKNVEKAKQKGAGQNDIDRMVNHFRSNPVYTTRIVEQVPAGEGARGVVLGKERLRVERLCEQEGLVFKNPAPGNRERVTIKFKEQIR